MKDFQSQEMFEQQMKSLSKEGYIPLSKPLELELEFEDLSQEEITTACVKAIDSLIEIEKEKASKVISSLMEKRQEYLSLTFNSPNGEGV